MPVQPLKDFLLLRDPPDAQHPSGLYVPESTDTKVKKGLVVAVGPDAGKKPSPIYFSLNTSTTGESDCEAPAPVYRAGDVVLYSIFGANELREGGVTYYLVPDKEVWGKIVV
jgi:co-chaperonin GroES (HSP10)